MDLLFLQISEVYVTLHNILEDRSQLLVNESDDIKNIAKHLQYSMIYTGSNVLKLYGLIDRPIKDHDVVIQVYSEKSVEIINRIFEQWCKKYPTAKMYNTNLYGDKSLYQFQLKLTCELSIDVFIGLNTNESHTAYPCPPKLKKDDLEIKLGKPLDIFRAKGKFDKHKAYADAMTMVVKFIKETDEKKDADKPDMPF